MNALAKTSNNVPDFETSMYQSTPLFTTNRQLLYSVGESATPSLTRTTGKSDEVIFLNTIANNETRKPVKISLPHLMPQIPATFPRSFQLLQQWEGRVEQVNADTFMAIISDKTITDNPEEEVEIFLSEVGREDLSFIRPGALFYWSVGYDDGRGEPRQRVSRIRFRRLPGLTRRDIARAESNAKELASLFA